MKNLAISVFACLLLLGSSLSAQDPIPNIRISFPSTQLQNEEQVFYCPTDSNVILATWRDFRLGYRQCALGRSDDGGATWTDYLNTLLLSFDNWQSDPTMTVDRTGAFYCSFLDFSPTADNDSSWISFIKSVDKGLTWTGPYAVVPDAGLYFEDKQFITVDRTGGMYDGNVYVTWARFPNPTRMMFARSLDGAETFEDTIIVGPSIYHEPCGFSVDAGQFAQPIVGSDGSVYVFWSGSDLLPNDCMAFYAMKMSKSNDGGQTWSTMAEPMFRYNNYSYVDGDINVYNCPAGDADITGGPYDGNIYISTTNGNSDDVFYHADIVMIKSTDGGQTWLPPIRINDDPLGVNVDQFHPWLVVNEDGVIATIFYDQRMDPNHYMFDVFAAYSFDGGETFTTNHRITDVSSSPDDLRLKNGIFEAEKDPQEGMFDDDGEYHLYSPKAGKIAEYIGVTSFHDNVTAVWTDTRLGNQDVFAAYYRLPFLRPRLYTDGVINGSSDSLYWSTCWHEGDVSYLIEVDDDQLFGSPEISTTVGDNKLYFPQAALTDGQWYYRVRATRTSLGDNTEFSETGMFILDNEAPAMPVPTYPADLTVTDSLPTFSWTATVDPSGSTEYYELELSGDPGFPGTQPYQHYEDIATDTFTIGDALTIEGSYYWRVNHYDEAGNASGYSAAATFEYVKYVCGDANGDTAIDVGDAVYIINYVFKGGPPPDPIESGDANCDHGVDVGDAVYIINYVFKGGPDPCCP